MLASCAADSANLARDARRRPHGAAGQFLVVNACRADCLTPAAVEFAAGTDEQTVSLVGLATLNALVQLAHCGLEPSGRPGHAGLRESLPMAFANQLPRFGAMGMPQAKPLFVELDGMIVIPAVSVPQMTEGDRAV